MTVNRIGERGSLYPGQKPADGSIPEAAGTASPAGSVPEHAADRRRDAKEELIYRPSKLQEEDIRRAVSDMKKDKVLWQYQYFVDSGRVSKDAFRSWEEGSVRVTPKRVYNDEE